MEATQLHRRLCGGVSHDHLLTARAVKALAGSVMFVFDAIWCVDGRRYVRGLASEQVALCVVSG